MQIPKSRQQEPTLDQKMQAQMQKGQIQTRWTQSLLQGWTRMGPQKRRKEGHSRNMRSLNKFLEKKTAQNWQKSTNNGSRFEFNNYLMTETIKMEYDHGLLKIISAYDDQIMVRGSWNKIWVWNRSYNLKQSCETNSGRPRPKRVRGRADHNFRELAGNRLIFWKCLLHTT